MKNTPPAEDTCIADVPLEKFLQEMGETPLLERNEERILAAHMLLGDMEAHNQLV